jgi:mannose-6-phosphate isomerase
MKLKARAVEKPWGREALPPGFEAAQGKRIGEIWFEAADGRPLPLLVKYLFTGDRLSVQVHPDDAQARARGLANGKNECWYIVDAEPEAAVALGLRRAVSAAQLRSAALDGSIEKLLRWIPVKAGDVLPVPAGTIHAIGAGISLIEVQQPSDTTYRLYDYGRPRTLHLDEALAVALRSAAPAHPKALFAMEPLAGDTADPLEAHQRWLLPLRGLVEVAGAYAGPGECLLAPPGEAARRAPGSLVLVAGERLEGAAARPRRRLAA